MYSRLETSITLQRVRQVERSDAQIWYKAGRSSVCAVGPSTSNQQHLLRATRPQPLPPHTRNSCGQAGWALYVCLKPEVVHSSQFGISGPAPYRPTGPRKDLVSKTATAPVRALRQYVGHKKGARLGGRQVQENRCPRHGAAPKIEDKTESRVKLTTI